MFTFKILNDKNLKPKYENIFKLKENKQSKFIEGKDPQTLFNFLNFKLPLNMDIEK